MGKAIFNFNAGPAALPPEVLEEMAIATREYEGTGMSVLELPHRGAAFLEILEECNVLVKELCGLNNDYHVLWLQGGGRMQFAMVPMNFLQPETTAAYIDSGHWANEAIAYATYYGGVKILGSSKDTGYDRLPSIPLPVVPDYCYLHITTNNTIYGTQYRELPQVSVPLVADASSDIFGVPRDYTQFSMFYAAVQKNLGTPGLALAVIRNDFLEQAAYHLPPMLSYKAHVKEKGILNTANVSGTYTSLLMLRWIKAKGLDNIYKANEAKANLLYATIDHSKLFVPHVKLHEHRSMMNVTFTAKDRTLEQPFLQLCHEHGIIGIEGHRSVGGFRVSLYNAIEYSAVEKLCGLMREFEGSRLMFMELQSPSL